MSRQKGKSSKTRSEKSAEFRYIAFDELRQKGKSSKIRSEEKVSLPGRVIGSSVRIRRDGRLSGGVPDQVELELKIREEAQKVFKPEAVDRWLTTPKRFLQGRTPIEAIRQGDGDLVYATLVALKEGAHV